MMTRTLPLSESTQQAGINVTPSYLSGAQSQAFGANIRQAGLAHGYLIPHHKIILPTTAQHNAGVIIGNTGTPQLGVQPGLKRMPKETPVLGLPLAPVTGTGGGTLIGNGGTNTGGAGLAGNGPLIDALTSAFNGGGSGSQSTQAALGSLQPVTSQTSSSSNPVAMILVVGVLAAVGAWYYFTHKKKTGEKKPPEHGK